MFDGLFSIDGRTALVTGGSRGIGKMIAEGFVAAGVNVYICSRNAAQCESTANALAALGPGSCTPLAEDLSTVAGCRSLATVLGRRVTQLDILVNNAGIGWAEDFDDFSESGWDSVMTLNLKSPFFLTQALRPLLANAARQERPAKVINIASVDGIRLNQIENYSYQASKAALIYLTRRMAARLVRHHIVVSGIAPGPFATELNPMAQYMPDAVIGGTPARRLGTPEDMVGAAIYLASRAGDYVVGSTISVDGGIGYALDS